MKITRDPAGAEQSATPSTGETEDSMVTVFPRELQEAVQFVAKFQPLLTPQVESTDARELPLGVPFLL